MQNRNAIDSMDCGSSVHGLQRVDVLKGGYPCCLRYAVIENQSKFSFKKMSSSRVF